MRQDLLLIKPFEMQVDDMWLERGQEEVRWRQSLISRDICHNRMLDLTSIETITQLGNVKDVNLPISCNGNC